MDTARTAGEAPTAPTPVDPEQPVVHGAPVPLTSLVGRTSESGEVAVLLAEHRLVTLIGAGGIGKTRLAAAVAPAVPSARSWWVSLASTSLEPAAPDATLASVLAAVAGAVGAPPGPATTAADRLARHLSGPPTLLVLDTCEHVATACGALAEQLLVRCPRLRILATSRAPLHAAGELLWPVPPLAFPEEGQLLLPTHLEEYDAVRLFVERAGAVQHGFALTAHSAPSVVAVCRRLEGNPLAIELAAARVRVLGPAEIADALDEGVDLLVSRSPTAPPRQQTLRATLDWSHALLDAAEATLLRRLSVFVGGAGLGAVLSVCGLILGNRAATLDLLSGLDDKSLLLVIGTVGGSRRFVLAEPVRRYAVERLVEADEEVAVRARHLQWCLELASGAAQALGAEQVSSYDELEAELPNIRSALGWATATGRTGAALTLAVDLADFCAARGHHREGRRLLADALSAAAHDPSTPDPALVDRAHGAAGVLDFLLCEYPQAEHLLIEASAGYDRRGDLAGAARTRQALAGVRRERGDFVIAAATLDTCLSAWQRLGDDRGVARCLSRMAFTALLCADAPRAAALARECLDLAIDDPATTASALVVLGHTELAAGRADAAYESFSEALQRADLARLPEEKAYAEEGLGRAVLALGEPDGAAAWLASALEAQHALGDQWRTAAVLVAGAAADTAREDHAEAQQLLGASRSLLAGIGGALGRPDHELADQLVAAGDDRLGPETAARLRSVGARLSVEQVIAGAIVRLDRPRTPLPSAFTSPDQPTVAAPGCGTGADARTERSAPPFLAVVALGRPTVALDDRELHPADFAYAKPRELLFLLLEHPEGLGKDRIGATLWPEASPAGLRGAFHTTLHHLREAVGPDRVRYAGRRYTIVRTGLAYDVASFLGALDAARTAAAGSAPDSEARELTHLSEAVAAYGGDYLAGVDGDWVVARREELRRRADRALLAQGRLLLRAGRPLAAGEAFRRAARSDPLLEAAHRGLMSAYATAGEPGHALRQYELLTATLRAELDAEPSAETATLARRIAGMPRGSAPAPVQG